MLLLDGIDGAALVGQQAPGDRAVDVLLLPGEVPRQLLLEPGDGVPRLGQAERLDGHLDAIEQHELLVVIPLQLLEPARHSPPPVDPAIA